MSWIWVKTMNKQISNRAPAGGRKKNVRRKFLPAPWWWALVEVRNRTWWSRKVVSMNLGWSYWLSNFTFFIFILWFVASKHKVKHQNGHLIIAVGLQRHGTDRDKRQCSSGCKIVWKVFTPSTKHGSSSFSSTSKTWLTAPDWKLPI